MGDREVIPVHAYGFFTVSSNLEVNEIVVYEYADYSKYYASIVKDLDRLNEELGRLAANMQSFLDAEEVVINGERVRPRVVGTSLGFRGDPEEPYVAFFVHFRGRPRRGLNYYENIYEEEVAEYPYEAYWVFPPEAVVESVECSGSAEIIEGRIVAIRVEEGERVVGYEKIIFRLP